MRADMKRLLQVAVRGGCRVYATGSGHWRIVGPDGATITTVSSTPGSGAAYIRTRAALRRAGLL